MNEQEESAAIERCLAGDPSGFNVVVKQYLKPVYNLALRTVRDPDLARDVSQTTFIKAYEQLHTYDPDFKFFSWLYRIAINESINALKHHNHTVPLSDEFVSEESSPVDQLVERERSNEIEAALMKLPTDQRIVVVLRHYLDFSYGQMAEVLALEEKTVKSRLFSARQRLKEILKP